MDTHDPLFSMRSLSELMMRPADLQRQKSQASQGDHQSDMETCTEATSTCSDSDDNFLSAALGSVGEESLADVLGEDDSDDGPELNVESIHTFIGSARHKTASGVPKPKVLAQVSGTGLAPWEIHRPQKFVRDLVLRRCFSGRVLDAGCGIGDNALYVAKACPGAHVTAVDVVPRCLEFAAAKAGIRGMRGQLDLVVGNLLQQDLARMAPKVAPEDEGKYGVVLDSSTFHCFSDTEREPYVATMRRLLRPGGMIYMNCMSEEETRPGGPRRITVPGLLSVFNRSTGWHVETIEDSIIDLHPTFWGGKAKARLFTIRKL